ncbi:unnamed protein product [Leptidea sinapis]|uniref:Uncharacterized protein n=1 Tax=Leptidea sinapis TaxID=189913 RepID=A0A5E4PK98_9NEOP|nr:unnamed protein product [Leptidea sinapis]
MSDSSEYSSLFALVDSHLSKTSVKESQSNESTKGPFQIPFHNNEHGTSSSESYLLLQNARLPIPTFNISQSSITSVLAEQVSNMLKAKEKKKQEELQKLDSEMKKLKVQEKDDYVIDLMQALQTPSTEMKPKSLCEEPLSSSSSFESLFQPKFSDFIDEKEKQKNPDPLKPCITVKSHLMKKKIKKGKCSEFGRVLSARLRPIAAPYLRQSIESNIEVFDFSTPSPCDIYKANLRKPTVSSTFSFKLELLQL